MSIAKEKTVGREFFEYSRHNCESKDGEGKCSKNERGECRYDNCPHGGLERTS